MWHKKEYLKRCQELSRVGFETTFEEGTTLARGFADLGFEEYCVLTNNRLLSLFTGKITELQDVERIHFFEILSVDRMMEEIHKRGWDVLKVTSEDQRLWSLEMQRYNSEINSVKDIRSVEARSIQEVVLEALTLTFS